MRGRCCCNSMMVHVLEREMRGHHVRAFLSLAHAPSCCVVIGGGGARFCFETAYGTYIYFLMCMDQSFLRQG